MAKLYFKYGVMGASKSAQALITKFNYEEGDNKVLLIKPATDTRDGADIIRSRIGLEGKAVIIPADDASLDVIRDKLGETDVIICDESQFLTPEQVDALHNIATDDDIPVLCYGLMADFQTHLFAGSKRLVECAESLQEIKMVCACGRKATVTARLDADGHVVTQGAQVVMGGTGAYTAMCYHCYRDDILHNTKRDV